MDSKIVRKTHCRHTIFNLKQDNFQDFLKNPKSEAAISVAYWTEFVSSIASIVFYLGYLFLFCLHLLSYFAY